MVLHHGDAAGRLEIFTVLVLLTPRLLEKIISDGLHV